MLKFLKGILAVFLLQIFIPVAGTAQTATLTMLQDSLKNLGFRMYNEPAETDRLQANYQFIPTLVSALKSAHSFDFSFDSLKMIPIQYPPDRSFRIFSWHIQLNDGSYRYFGTIQMNTKNGTLKLFPLVDHTAEISNPQTEELNSKKWFGAQYYQIIQLDKNKAVYLLLGWKGKSPQTTQKVIEILQFKNQEPVFGDAVFEGKEGNPSKRMIYEFSKQASMFMEYDDTDKQIVVDHLSPADDKFKGDFTHYGPDMTQDAWVIRNGRLILKEDIIFSKKND